MGWNTKRNWTNNFRKSIITGVKIADLYGMKALRHPTNCTEYTAEEWYSLIARVLAEESQKSVAISASMNDSKFVKLGKAI